MTEGLSRQLDAFEERLLSELKALAATQAEAVPPPLSSARTGRQRLWYLPTAGIAAAAVAITVIAVNARPTPAYAVSGGNGEEITVQVNRLEGAGALERALRARGVTADITYLSPDKACQPGRYAILDTPGLMLSVSAARFQVTIPPGAVGEHDTFVLSAAVRPFDNGVQATVDFGVAEGVVAPCSIVDAP